MNEWPDMRLLREYAEHGTEAAFNMLVSRHLAMVFRAALRQTRHAQLAEEVTQTVFTVLAQKARRISTHTVLSGWLFNTTRFVSTRAVRDEQRRQYRQAESIRMSLDSSPSEPLECVEQVLPLLDELMARLSKRDRGAVLARYFEDKSFRQVALATGLTEEAAKKRVQRALEKLRKMLAARGVAVTVTALGTCFGAAKAQALPAGLSAVAVSSAALKGASGLTALSTLTQSTLEYLKWTKLKVAGTTVLALALGTVTVTDLVNQKPQAAMAGNQPLGVPVSRNPVPALQERAERLRAENARLSAQFSAATARRLQLVRAGQEARRAAQQSREFTAQNLVPTNGPPTLRDGFVSLGRLLRLSSVSETNLTAEERRASRDAASQETLRLLQAKAQFPDLDDYSPASPEEAADLATGLLHGIIELTPEQFGQVREALVEYETQALREAPQHKLLLPEPEHLGVALDQIQALLSQPQREILERVLQKTAGQPSSGQNAVQERGQRSGQSP